MLFEEYEKSTQNLISFIHWIITYQNAKKKKTKTKGNLLSMWTSIEDILPKIDNIYKLILKWS